VDPYLVNATRLSRAATVAAKAPEPVLCAKADPNGRASPASAEASALSRRLRPLVLPAAFAALALLFCVVLGTSLVGRVRVAREGAEVAVAERAALEAEWKIVAPQMEEAEKARAGFASLPKRTKSIAEERNARGWTRVLRVASINAGPEIDLRSVTARCAAGVCELRLEGAATGAAPRAIADEFCQAQRRELEPNFPGGVVAQFEKLEDEPESSALSSGEHRARFTLKVSVGLTAPPHLEGTTAK
jgi:hypothetical protein